MKRTLLVALALSSLTAYGQSITTGSDTTATTSTASAGSFMDGLKNSPLKLRLIEQFNVNAEEGKVASFGNDFYITPSYKITDKDKIELDNLVQHSLPVGGVDVDSKWTYTTLNYYRSGLLTSDDYGFDLSANARYRFYKNTFSNNENNYAYGRVGLTASRSITPAFSAMFSTQFAVYERTSGGEGVPVTYLYPYAYLSYSVNDQVSLGVLAEYIRKFTKNEGAFYTSGDNVGKKIYDKEDTFLTLEAYYTFTPSFNVGLSVGGQVDSAHDGKDAFEGLSKNLTYAANATYNVF